MSQRLQCLPGFWHTGLVTVSLRLLGRLMGVVALTAALSACSAGDEVVAGEVDAQWCQVAHYGFRAIGDLQSVRYFESDDLPYIQQLDPDARQRVEDWLASRVDMIRDLRDLEVPPSIEEAWTEVVTRTAPVVAGGQQTQMRNGKGPDWDEAWSTAVGEFRRDNCAVPAQAPTAIPPELLTF